MMPNHAATALLLDEPFLRVPIESVNTALRSGYKTLELDLTRLSTYAARHVVHNDVGLTPFSGTGDDNADQEKRISVLRSLLASITRMLEFMKKIQKKTEAYKDEVAKYTDRTIKRLIAVQEDTDWVNFHTIAALSAIQLREKTLKCPKFTTFQLPSATIFSRLQRRLDVYIFDYLVRVGLVATAKQLRDSEQIHDFVDEELSFSVRSIVTALQQGDVEPALSWCSTHKTKLRKLNNTIETILRLQQAVCLIEQGNVLEGITYIRTHFQPKDIVAVPELKEVFCLLAFLDPHVWDSLAKLNVDMLPSKYRSLFQPQRWSNCAELFQTAVYNVYGFPRNSTLVFLIQCGAAVLKSRACQESVSPSCPTCNPFWKQWLNRIITTHHGLSCIVCPIKEHVMTDSDPPLASPDGLVFSTSSVTELCQESSDGKMQCPFTGNRYSFERFHRLYIS